MKANKKQDKICQNVKTKNKIKQKPGTMGFALCWPTILDTGLPLEYS